MLIPFNEIPKKLAATWKTTVPAILICIALVSVAAFSSSRKISGPNGDGSTAGTPGSIVNTTSTGAATSTVLNMNINPSGGATGTKSAGTNGVCVLNVSFVDTTPANAQGTASYAIAAKNAGSGNCTSASISVYYADNETAVSASPKATSGGYYWSIGTLAAGKEYDVALQTNRASTASAEQAVPRNEACLSASGANDACTTPGHTAQGTTMITASQPNIPLATTLIPQAGKELGVWEWTPVTKLSQGDMQTAIANAAANHFNAIYLTIDDYLTIAAEPDGATKQSQLDQYTQSINAFLTMANARGMAVDAEAGWRDWGESPNAGKAGQILSFVANWNQSHATKFRGVQYDIEPYLLPQYNDGASAILTDYVRMVENTVNQDAALGGNQLPLTIVLPHFFDSGIQWTPKITIDGTSSYTYEQVLRILGKVTGSRIIVMAYRNFASGSDGSVALAQQEVTEANTTGVKVIVAQETGPVTPGYTTFSGKSKTAVAGQVGLVNQAFANDGAFAGIAIDYLDPFLELPNDQ